MGRLKNTLTVLESPWSSSSNDISDYSMRPFVEGLALLHEWRLIYRTFTTAAELGQLVEREGFAQDTKRALLYISTHGLGNYLSGGIFTENYISLARLGAKLKKGVEGVWLGACEVGGSRNITAFLTRKGARWVGGYSCSVHWETTMLVDIAVLNEAMQGAPLTTAKRVVRAFERSLTRFRGTAVVGDDGRADVELRRAVHVWARDGRREPRELSGELKAKLGWE